MSRTRHPAVAGQFYEGRPEELTASIRECFLHELGPGSLPQLAAEGPGAVSAVVSPHAGYIYSGPAAAHGFAALAADGIPDTVVILGPSHRLVERRAAVSTAEAWLTPLGKVPVDVSLCAKLAEGSPLLQADEDAHRFEHSLEVQVPFLQFVYGERVPKICPICVRSHPFGAVEELVQDAEQVGRTIAGAVADRRAVVIASTDFSHQIPHNVAERQDRLALDAILALDPERLLRTVSDHDISMCGPVPVAIALHCCLIRGAHQAELLRYYTSGDIIGDRSAVVGYASVLIRRAGGETV
jgi:AmmeMemoRadiSam system protein B